MSGHRSERRPRRRGWWLHRALDGADRHRSRPRQVDRRPGGRHHCLRRIRTQRWLLRGLAHPRARERRRPLARRGRQAPPPRRREPAGATRRHTPPRHRLLTGTDRCAERGSHPVAGRLPARQRLAPRGTRHVRDPAGCGVHRLPGELTHLPGRGLAPRRRGEAATWATAWPPPSWPAIPLPN